MDLRARYARGRYRLIFDTPVFLFLFFSLSFPSANGVHPEWWRELAYLHYSSYCTQEHRSAEIKAYWEATVAFCERRGSESTA